MTSGIDALGEPNTDTLAHPPLELVVCQVRHESRPVIADPVTILGLQAALGMGFDRLEPLNSAEITIAPGQNVQHVNQSAGWRLTRPDGSWIVTFMPDAFAVECTEYTTWSNFNKVLARVVEIISTEVGPKLVQRVGVRYVDRMWRQGSSIPAEWDGWLDPGVLGLANTPALAPHVRVAQTNCELTFGDFRANVRGSIAADQTPNKHSFLLDIDCFDERAMAFNRDGVSEVVQQLHSLSLRLFQSILTEDLYRELHG